MYVIAEREMPKDSYNKHPQVLDEMRSEFVYMQEQRDINKVYYATDITGNY